MLVALRASPWLCHPRMPPRSPHVPRSPNQTSPPKLILRPVSVLSPPCAHRASSHIAPAFQLRPPGPPGFWLLFGFPPYLRPPALVAQPYTVLYSILILLPSVPLLPPTFISPSPSLGPATATSAAILSTRPLPSLSFDSYFVHFGPGHQEPSATTVVLPKVPSLPFTYRRESIVKQPPTCRRELSPPSLAPRSRLTTPRSLAMSPSVPMYTM